MKKRKSGAPVLAALVTVLLQVCGGKGMEFQIHSDKGELASISNSERRSETEKSWVQERSERTNVELASHADPEPNNLQTIAREKLMINTEIINLNRSAVNLTTVDGVHSSIEYVSGKEFESQIHHIDPKSKSHELNPTPAWTTTAKQSTTVFDWRVIGEYHYIRVNREHHYRGVNSEYH